LVDAERAGARLSRLEKLIEDLESIRAEGEDAYLAQDRLRMAAERELELAVQICIDIGTQLVMERSVRAPESYADVFRAMADADLLPRDLAERLSAAARQRNLLVHLYLEINDRKVFDSLNSLDDLRQFGEIVGRRIDD
jgi:uncharacterized protein YutE (UPF0331/DUF86 family)